jgi:hypothetical protein
MGIRKSSTKIDNGETNLPYDEIDWSLNYRKNKEKYVVGRGQFGVLKYQPYKLEILPLWKYKNKSVAKVGARRIFRLFHWYLSNADFPGADMARKYLYMGFTRPMRYAKYPGGKKYNDDGSEKVPHGPDTTGSWADAEKREAACVYKRYWDSARNNKQYQRLKSLHESGELYQQHTLDTFQKS